MPWQIERASCHRAGRAADAPDRHSMEISPLVFPARTRSSVPRWGALFQGRRNLSVPWVARSVDHVHVRGDADRAEAEWWRRNRDFRINTHHSGSEQARKVPPSTSHRTGHTAPSGQQGYGLHRFRSNSDPGDERTSARDCRICSRSSAPSGSRRTGGRESAILKDREPVGP